VKDGSRKTVECPDCGARFVPGSAAPPAPPKRSRREEDSAPAPKKGGSGLIIAGVLLFLFLGLGVAGGLGWYFGFKRPADRKKAEEQAQAQNQPPVTQATDAKLESKGTLKRLKITSPPKLEGNDIYKLLLPSTVMIRTDHGLGTGVLICRDPNLVITNHHVVEEFAMVRVFFPEFAQNGQVIHERTYYEENRFKLAIMGRVLDRDRSKDLAVVEIDRVPETALPVPLAKESAHELDEVFGIGGSAADINALWQAHKGSVRQVLPASDIFDPMRCRLLITQSDTYFGDSGGPIVNHGVELVAVVEGGLPSKAKVGKNSKGENVIKVDVRPGMDLNVDVEEIREMVNKVYRLNFVGSFPEAPPLHEPGIVPSPEDENYSAGDYVQILREGDPNQARAAVDRLVNLGGQSVGPLKDMLEDPKASPRWPQALTALEKIGAPAADVIDVGARKLSDENPSVRIAAIKYLAAMGSPARKYVPAIIQASQGNNPTVKNAAEKAVIKLGPFGKDDQEVILGKGEDKDPNVRGLRARLLVEMDIEHAEKVRLMSPFFKDPHSIVRSDAARAVCKPDKFPRSDVYKQVIPMLGDAEYSVRSAAREALHSMGRVEVADLETLRPFLNSDSAEIHFYVLQRIRPLGERASPIVPELSKSLNFNNDEVKFEAIQAALGIDRDLKLLTKDFIKLSTHEKPSFRWAAIQCLKQIGKDEPGILSAMFERLSDGAEVAAAPSTLETLAVKSFGEFKDKSRLISDLPPVNPKAPPVWLYTSILLDEMRPFKSEAQVKEVKESLKPSEKRSMFAQYYAALSIAESAGAARAALEDLLATLADPKVTNYLIRQKLCLAIGNCGEEASRGAKLLAEVATSQVIEDRARAESDPERIKNQAVRAVALQALGKMGRGANDALPALTKLASPNSDPGTQDETIKTLGNLGPAAASAVTSLMELFGGARPGQRDLIVETMRKIGPDAFPPLIEFIPAYEKNWRENSGPYRDQNAKARGCVECIIVLGPEGLKPEQRAKLIDSLKTLRARAAVKGQKDFHDRCEEAVNRLEGKK
jgi:HEAT repeat protein